MLFAALLLATSSTFCQTAEVKLAVGTTDLMLVGCGQGFNENTLWHLDRGDSVDGSLDGIANRPATGKGALVYVCDSGVMRDHQEFSRPGGSNVIAGLQGHLARCPGGSVAALAPCFSYSGDLFYNTHGTAVASMIAGRNTGVAPDAQIVSVLTLHAGAAAAAPWVEAFDSIIAHAWEPTTPQVRTAIVNMSQSLLANVNGLACRSSEPSSGTRAPRTPLHSWPGSQHCSSRKTRTSRPEIWRRQSRHGHHERRTHNRRSQFTMYSPDSPDDVVCGTDFAYDHRCGAAGS